VTSLSRGWAVVAACGLIAACSWGLGFYGLGVYLAALHRLHGWPTSLISAAITMYYLVGAAGLFVVGEIVARRGPAAVMVYGSITMGAAIAVLGWLSAPWQLFAVLAVMGTSWACLSSTAITAAILPWFPQRSAAAVTLALTGASIGGMVFVPALVAIGQARGFAALAAAGAGALFALSLPLAALVVRHPAGSEGTEPAAAHDDAGGEITWTRRQAMRTRRFWTLTLSFGLVLTAQVGFIVHQLAFLAPALGDIQAALAVSATTISALLGRIGAGTLADRMDGRVLSAGMFGTQAAALAAMAVSTSPAVLFSACVVFGLNVGNVITMPPLLVHAEFGVRSFPIVFGMASAAMQVGVAIGPGLVGLLRDLSGGYAIAIGVVATLDGLAVAAVLWGRHAHRAAVS